MNCTFCKRPIVLVPSAAERAAKDVTGRPASFFTSLFTEHSECTLHKREVTTSHLMTWAKRDTPRITKTGTRHLYRFGVGAGRSVDVEANDRNQAARILESYGYEVRDCNMIG